MLTCSLFTLYYLSHRFIIVIDTVGSYMDSLQPLVYRLNSAVLVYTAYNPSLVHGMLYKNQVGYNPPGGLNKFLIPMTQGRRVLATQEQSNVPGTATIQT